jgi:hypothetical protein
MTAPEFWLQLGGAFALPLLFGVMVHEWLKMGK